MSTATSTITSRSDRTRDLNSSITYTRTGRISKARKGIRGAHVCSCGKDYSRAEHLRRHQQNHDNASSYGTRVSLDRDETGSNTGAFNSPHCTPQPQKAALDNTLTLSFASVGNFYPHPTIDFWPAPVSTSVSPTSVTQQVQWMSYDSSGFVSMASTPESGANFMGPSVTSGSVPYPLPWTGTRDRYGTLNIEGLLENQQLGLSLNLGTKQHYVKAYWEHFHPLFSILHKQSYRSHTPSPLLSAAVMAIGAQYTDEPAARHDSRILHEKCLELIAKCKLELSATPRLDYMQAVVLVEFMSQFKAKRAASALSDVFMTTYPRLWHIHDTTPRSRFDELAQLPAQSTEGLRHQWGEWVQAHSFERLLSACFILEAQQALLLVRTNTTNPDAGLSLYVPASTSLWEAPSHTRWAQIASAGVSRTSDMFQLLDEISSPKPPTRLEPFPSTILTALQASFLSSAQSKQTPYTHPLLDPSNAPLLQRALATHPSVLITHHAVLLAEAAPLRALLAASGQSWVLSRRLADTAAVAVAEFETLKAVLRAWAEGAQEGAERDAPGLVEPTPGPQSAPRALHAALTILGLALDSVPQPAAVAAGREPRLPALAFGAPEMATYLSALALWAAALEGVRGVEGDEDGEWDAGRAEGEARVFIRDALLSLV
ncbi:hypothetical protein EJ06DRAFT_522406 [Trichodelitschia bisporula]|uniref:Xylanolytic transcriptional activator regulatory domain-containing protein n=1 Tax=Trichodelitschia bisporula TaxID=703511 RepID=A0A6G1HU10_9PEZI|nr:hypothetical protein EJ06DRAFT_522406 [Trichodelitschia bisporula]